MSKTTRYSHSCYLTLVQIASIVLAIWVLYTSIDLNFGHITDSMAIQLDENGLYNGPIIWGILFFIISLIIALSFITLTFFISFRDD